MDLLHRSSMTPTAPPPTACQAESPGYVRMLIVFLRPPVYDDSSSHQASTGGFLAELAEIRLQEHKELPLRRRRNVVLGQMGKNLSSFGWTFCSNELIFFKETITSFSGTAVQQTCLSFEVSVLLEFSLLFLSFIPHFSLDDFGSKKKTQKTADPT